MFQTRRAEIECSLSESAVDTKNLHNTPYFMELEPILGVSNPEGGNRALSIRIRGRYILTFSRHLMKHYPYTHITLHPCTRSMPFHASPCHSAPVHARGDIQETSRTRRGHIHETYGDIQYTSRALQKGTFYGGSTSEDRWQMTSSRRDVRDFR